jgi:hypothetical protein
MSTENTSDSFSSSQSSSVSNSQRGGSQVSLVIGDLFKQEDLAQDVFPLPATKSETLQKLACFNGFGLIDDTKKQKLIKLRSLLLNIQVSDFLRLALPPKPLTLQPGPIILWLPPKMPTAFQTLVDRVGCAMPGNIVVGFGDALDIWPAGVICVNTNNDVFISFFVPGSS